MQAHLRIARPTRSIHALLPFYTTGLGFQITGSFEKHAGFDGVMLGHPSLPYHLEFTEQEGHDPGRAPTQEHLLVFYLPKKGGWDQAVARMEGAGFTSEELRLALAEDNIEARPLWKPMHLQPVFRNAAAYVDGTSERLFRTGLSLPSGSALTDDQVERVTSTLTSFLHGARRAA